MKKIQISILILVLLCISACVCSCNEELLDDSKQGDNDLNDSNSYMNIYYDILNNNTLLFDTNTNKKVFLQDYLNDAGLTKSKYSFVDLDEDATEEMIIWLFRGTNEYRGFLILRINNDDVYAYELSYRNFYELKEDGTFMYSSSASDYGIGKINFVDATYTIIPIVYCKSTDGDHKTHYYIDNSSISKKDFDNYIMEQNKKVATNWAEFTLDPSLEN